MRIRVVSSKEEIDDLRSDEQLIHLAFRASNEDIFKLLQVCPRIKAIQLPSSYRKTLSQAARLFLEMQGVRIIEGDIWGHRKDLSEYFVIPDDIVDRINKLRDQGIDPEEIASLVSEEAKISPNMVKYVIWRSS